MPEKQKKPRLETADPESLTLPDLAMPHLIEMLQSVGFCSPGFNGPQQITWQEIASWRMSTGAELTGWEAETLYRLSGAYAAMIHKAKDPSCPCPVSAKPEKDQRQTVNQFFRNLPTRKVQRRG